MYDLKNKYDRLQYLLNLAESFDKFDATGKQADGKLWSDDLEEERDTKTEIHNDLHEECGNISDEADARFQANLKRITKSKKEK